MRIVLDMQGAQSESRYRGIGRYTLSFAQAIVRNGGEHEIILALSGLLPESIPEIRKAFDNLLPQVNIRVWYAPGPVAEINNKNSLHRQNAELIREAFLRSLQPDVIHVFSLFEGYVDDAVSSIGRFDHDTFVSATIFDLIPLLNPDKYLQPDPVYASYYKNKLENLKKANLLVAISESSKKEALENLPDTQASILNCYLGVDTVFTAESYSEFQVQQIKQQFAIKKHFVLYTGGVDERKNLPRLIEAYSQLPQHLRAEHQLVFAGRIPDTNQLQLKRLAKKNGLKANEIIFTGYVSDAQLNQLYNLCALFVFPSLHEGFGLPALEAMSCGADVIASNTSSLPEVIVIDEAMFDPYDINAIRDKIHKGLTNPDFKQKLKNNATHQAEKFSWQLSANALLKTWVFMLQEKSEKKQTQKISSLDTLSGILDSLINALDKKAISFERERLMLAHCLSKTFPDSQRQKQILVDVSELSQRDSKSGIQRVVKNILENWFKTPLDGWTIKAVYAKQQESGYFYANKFTQGFLGISGNDIEDQPAEAWSGDIFIMLDLQHHILQAQEKTLQSWRDQGVVIKTLIYDLLPIQLPDAFIEGTQSLHQNWLILTSSFDGVICISEAVAKEYQTWVHDNKLTTSQSFSIDWFHLGADISHGLASSGLPENAEKVIKEIKEHTSFLMVGTIEPRKAHAQTLKAFEQLWQQDLDYRLILVGKQGWLVEELIEKIKQHPEFNNRLLWLEGISDEFLEKIYASASCLIAASYGEGFGLPLIEAAQHKIPIIARDIPVFREVAGEHAFYFENIKEAEVIVTAIKSWVTLYHQGKHPVSGNMPRLSWQESSQQLTKVLLSDKLT